MRHRIEIGGILFLLAMFQPVIGMAAGCPTEPTPSPETKVTHCLAGCPTGAPDSNKLIERSIYTLSNNGTRRLAQWLAYVVEQDSIGKSQKRVWCRDPNLPAEETLAPSDYKGAFNELRTDRGHQVPLASFSGTEDWAMTNYLSNITPQKSALNQGPWKDLETVARNLAQTSENVFVMTGPLFERDVGRLPANDAVSLPSGYWKILAVEMDGTIEAVGFIMDQDLPRSADFCEQSTTIDEIERRSGLDFYHKLADVDEEALEAKLPVKSTDRPGTEDPSLPAKMGC